MKRNFKGFLYAILITVAVGCGTTQKIMKTGDPQYIYEQGLALYDQEKWADASTLFEYISSYYTGSPREDSLSFYNAHCKYKQRLYAEAGSQLDDYRRQFGRSVFIEDAEGMYAMCQYFLAPGSRRDPAMTNMAINAVSEFIVRYPNSDKIEAFKEIHAELMERVYAKSFDNAYTYYKIGRYKSSLVAFKNAQKAQPTSTFSEDIAYYIVMSNYKLASNSVASKQTDRYIEMVDSYYTFIAKYPESEHRKELDRLLKSANSYLEKNKVEEESEI